MVRADDKAVIGRRKVVGNMSETNFTVENPQVSVARTNFRSIPNSKRTCVGCRVAPGCKDRHYCPSPVVLPDTSLLRWSIKSRPGQNTFVFVREQTSGPKRKRPEAVSLPD